MHSLEKKTHKDDKFLNPSFSSTLLDKIYRSMDEGERKSGEMKFYRETTTVKKQNRSSNVKCNRNMVEEEQGKRKDKKVGTEKPCFVLPTHHHHGYHRDHDQDALFFSSTSISSDSSSGGFSSSDTESSMYGAMSRTSCFAPPPKPNNKPAVKKNIEKQKQATTRMFHGFCHNSKTEGIAIHDDDDDDEKALFKSKLRALKIYNNLKKVKQPISPGGRLTCFLNSLFANNAKKTRSSSSSRSCYYEDMNTERKVKAKPSSSSVQVASSSSICSSASSFSRSCLSKTSSCEREKMFNGVKRTVSFHPVIVDEEEGKSLKGLKIGRFNTKKKKEEENKLPVLEKSRVVEEAAREFLEEYHHNRKSDLPLRTFSAPFETVAIASAKRINIVNGNDEDEGDDDDDAASYASSDLFELDHLSVLGNGRYCEELPVYETTHVSTNRAIVNGLIM